METRIALASLSSEPFLTGGWWQQIAAWVLSLVVFRSIVPVVYLLFAPGVAWHTKVRALSATAGAAGVTLALEEQRLRELPVFVVGLAYFTAICWLATELAPRLQKGSLTAPALFGICVIFCILVPCIVWPYPDTNPVRVYGFELALSIYSYAIDTMRGYTHMTRKEALFFLLVNPVLVVADRGRRLVSRRTLPALARMGHACVALACSVAVAQSYFLLADSDESSFQATAVRLATQITALLLLHSGGASIQIAWMRELGWEVPERYHWAILARDPAAFWQRWNTYVGSWARRYLFLPYALERRRAGTSSNVATVTAVLTTFLAVGAMHDLANYFAAYRSSVAWTFAFLAGGLLLLSWLGIALVSRFPAREERGVWPAAIIGRLLVVAQLAAMSWILAGLEDGQMNPILSEALGLRALGY